MNRTFTIPALLCVGALAIGQAAAADQRLALVTSEGENTVTVIDLLTEKTLKVLPTGAVPHAMAAAPDGTIFVNNRGSRDLTVIDANTLELTGTIDLPATSFQLGLSPDGKVLAVVYKDALKMSLVDTASKRIEATFDVADMPAGKFKGAMMKHPYWTEDGRYVYVADAVHKTLIKVDAAERRVAKRIPMNGVNHYLHPSPDGSVYYAVNETTNQGTSLTLIDAATDAIIADLPIPTAEGEGAKGHHAAFSPDNRFFLFGNLGASGLHVLDVEKRQWVKRIKTGKGVGHPAVSRDGRHIFVVHHKDGVISVIDLERQEFIKNIKIGDGTKQAHASYFTPDNRFYYAVASEDNVMAKIDVAKMEVVSTIPVAAKSMFFAIKEGNAYPPTE